MLMPFVKMMPYGHNPLFFGSEASFSDFWSAMKYKHKHTDTNTQQMVGVFGYLSFNQGISSTQLSDAIKTSSFIFLERIHSSNDCLKVINVLKFLSLTVQFTH